MKCNYKLESRDSSRTSVSFCSAWIGEMKVVIEWDLGNELVASVHRNSAALKDVHWNGKGGVQQQTESPSHWI